LHFQDVKYGREIPMTKGDVTEVKEALAPASNTLHFFFLLGTSARGRALVETLLK
jgi:hypothetical protein